jgi:phosphoserine aminotransferase
MSAPDRAFAARPALRPVNTCFMSGPCARHPGYSLTALETTLPGRTHRADAPTVVAGEY